MRKLPPEFYERNDVVQIAKDLLGKIVETNTGGIITSGRIVETEAYVAYIDKASHSYNGKRTQRNEHMYAAAGTAYVYICYGMHHMLNVVTNDIDVPDAVLIRAIEPLQGIDDMLLRTGKKVFDKTLTRGPGNVAKSLGINKQFSGLTYGGHEINIYSDSLTLTEKETGTSRRIGIDGAGEDAFLPYRFYIRENRFVSGRPVK